ncbi:MAG: hypothetical protein ACREV8_10085, partial [Gammaproteobacteria bacterium]
MLYRNGQGHIWLSLGETTRGDSMPEQILPRAKEIPSAAEKFAGQAHDLEALRKAVVDAASVGEGIWLSYLFVLLYIAIAAGGVTHK